MNSNEVIQAINRIATAKRVDAAKIEKLKTDIKDSLSEDKQLQAAVSFDEVLSGLHKDKGETNLLLLCELIYLFEENGVASEHAKKLLSVFKNLKISLKYLASFKEKNVTTSDNSVMHDACLFQVPDKDSCQFSDWQKLAANFMQEPKFRTLFEHAVSIEKQIELIRKSPVNPKARELKVIENELTKSGRDLKKLLRKDSAIITAEENKVIVTLTQRVLILKMELANASCFTSLARLNLAQLDAFYEKYKYESNKAYAILINAGVTNKKIAQFLALTRQDSNERIPDIIIEGDSIGYPGYRLRKLHVLEDEDAAVGAVLGRKTNCCQSITGEEGEACAIHGLTSPDGGFYVLFRGEEVIAQAWAWRSKNDAIVFDSIECALGYKKVDIPAFYETLAIELVTGKYTAKVACGSHSGVSHSIGVHSVFNAREYYKDYHGYSDSKKQRVVYDLECPYYFYGKEDKSRLITIEIIRAALQNVQTPLVDNKSFCQMINWAILEGQDDVLNLAKEISIEEGENKNFDSFLFYLKKHCSVNSIDESELFEDIISNKIYSEVRVNLSGETVLHLAMKNKNKNMVMVMLDKGVDINSSDENGKTILLYAAQSGDIDTCRSLMQRGADIDVIDSFGRSPLSYAARNGFTNICISLIEQGANIDVIDSFGCTPLHYAAQNGFTDICVNLIEHGSDFHIIDNSGYSPLLWAARNGLVDICSRLIDQGANVNVVDSKGGSPLIYAAKNGLADICESLIDQGANVNVIDKFRRSPLSYAAKNRLTNICSKLIDLKANVNGIDVYKKSPLFYAAKNGLTNICARLIELEADVNVLDIHNKSPLSYAAGNGHTDICSNLIVQGADINVIDTSDKTPLIYAAENGQTETCAKLIELGATIDSEYSKQTPLMVAAQNGFTETCAKLIELGANINALTRTYLKESPLLIAAKNGKANTCLMLINNGADMNAKDRKNNTPLVYAINNGLSDVVETLLKRGVDKNIKMNKLFHNECGEDIQFIITPIELAILAGRENILEIILKDDSFSKYLADNFVKIIELIHILQKYKQITESTAFNFKKMISSQPGLELNDLILHHADEEDQEKVIENICMMLVGCSQPDTIFDLENIPNEKKELVYQKLNIAIEEKAKKEGRDALSKPYAKIIGYVDSLNIDFVSIKRKL